jgi:hypothetical protein
MDLQDVATRAYYSWLLKKGGYLKGHLLQTSDEGGRPEERGVINRLMCGAFAAHVTGTTPPVEPPSCIRKSHFDKIERPRMPRITIGVGSLLDRPLPFCPG